MAVDNDPQGNLTSAFLEDPTQLKADILDIYQNNNHVEPEIRTSSPATVVEALEEFFGKK